MHNSRQGIFSMIPQLSKGLYGTAFLLAVGLSVTACSIPVVTLFMDDNGSPLAPGESGTVHFFTSDANFNTGISLGTGSSYDLQVGILSNWTDANVEFNEFGERIDETGLARVNMPVKAFDFTRRSSNHRWFELMLYQPSCGHESLRGVTDLDQDPDSRSYRFVAVCDGNLHLFVNDSPGFYMNNIGYASIHLSRVN